MFVDIMWVVVTGSAFMVYYDASKYKIGSIPDVTGFTNADAGVWATTTLVLWIISFPIYLLNRSQLIEKAKFHPKEPSQFRGIILAIFGLFFAFAFFNLIKNIESHSSSSWGDNYPSSSTRPIDQRQTYTELSGIQFCAKVDENLACINPGTRFRVGIVYAKVEQSKRFNTNYLYVKIYSIKGASESLFDKGSYEVNPDWGTFAIPITFEYAGKYKVVFRKIGDEKIGEGIVTIY